MTRSKLVLSTIHHTGEDGEKEKEEMSSSKMDGLSCNRNGWKT